MLVCVAGQSQNLFQTLEQCQALISVSLHLFGIDGFIDSLPAASTCARKRRPNEQFFLLNAISPLVAELVDLSDEFSNVTSWLRLVPPSDNMTTARRMSTLSKLAVWDTTRLNKHAIAIRRPRHGPGFSGCRKGPVMSLVLLLVRVMRSGAPMNMWLMHQMTGLCTPLVCGGWGWWGRYC